MGVVTVAAHLCLFGPHLSGVDRTGWHSLAIEAEKTTRHTPCKGAICS